MAKRTPERGDNRDDLELKKFKYDEDTRESFINIDDDRIVDAINGNTDTDSEIKNEALLANIEKEIDCGSNVKEILVRSRTGKKLLLALVAGETASKFVTIPMGCNYTDNSFYINKKIYLLCEAADMVEVLIKRKI